jgi:hypothetical protein
VALLPVSVPDNLRRPCPAPTLARATTEGAYSDAVVGLAQAYRCTAARLIAVDEILRGAEQ